MWCRVAEEELVITARAGRGLAEITRHRLSVPGSPRTLDEHYPHHPGGNRPRTPRPRPRIPEEIAFLAIGPGAERWLTEAAAGGAQRIRSKMARAVELAAVTGADTAGTALGLAAIAGRFGDDDLPAIIDHLAAEGAPGEVVIADEQYSAQPGTASWAQLGTKGATRRSPGRQGGDPADLTQPAGQQLATSLENWRPPARKTPGRPPGFPDVP